MVLNSNNVNKNNLIYVPRNIVKNTHYATGIRFANWNARSIKAKNKSTVFCDFVISNQLDVVALTETWLCGDSRDNHVMADIQNTLPNYKFHHIPRSYSRGGGVALLIRDGFHVHMKDLCEYESMECMDIVISSASTSFELVIIYRPPPSTENGLTSTRFFEELSSFMETLTVGLDNLLITGDFNIHVDEPEDRETSKFLNILDMHHLQQHVTEPTHKKNHILDLLISRLDCNLVSRTCVQSELPSDHFAVKCVVNVRRPGPSVKRVTSRSIRKIDPENFCNDVKSSLTSLSSDTDLNAMVNEFHTSLEKTLDGHAPLTERSVILRPHAPWYTESHRAEKQERRRR